MDIASAKQQIKNTVQIYLQKDALGRYRLPLVHQRPIFLLGAPGLGKTAIMQQVADEMGLGLVSYSMTHHTRQSALGLPFIIAILKIITSDQQQKTILCNQKARL